MLAQPVVMKPGKELEKLSFFVGDWEVTTVTKFGGKEETVKAEATFRWLPGEVWLQEEISMNIPSMGFMHGGCKMAWREETGEYVRHWTDNQTTLNFTSVGAWVYENTLEFSGSFKWKGEMRYSRWVLKKVSQDELLGTYFHSTDGESFRVQAEEKFVRRKG